jgi:hypothetical protein
MPPIYLTRTGIRSRSSIKARVESDDDWHRSDDSYSPRRDWRFRSPTRSVGPRFAYSRVMTLVSCDDHLDWEFAFIRTLASDRYSEEPMANIVFAYGSNPTTPRCWKKSIGGDFAHNAKRGLFVSARPSSLSLSWQGTGRTPEALSSFAWFSRYAGSLLLTIAGSIVSALAGYVIRELPNRLRSTLPPRRRSVLSKRVGHWLANWKPLRPLVALRYRPRRTRRKETLVDDQSQCRRVPAVRTAHHCNRRGRAY